MKKDRFRVHVGKLQEHCPAIVPVRVRRVKESRMPKNTHGDCGAVYNDEGHLVEFRIRIRSDVEYQFQVQLLIHEWAHAIAWTPQNGPGTLDDHDELWGLAYARVYRELD